MTYNNRLRMRDLFMNPSLSGVFPQFTANDLQNLNSFAQTEERVQRYLVAALNGKIMADGTIAVKGKHQAVLTRVRSLQSLIERFINNMPAVASALRKNTPLYLPYATISQLGDIKSSAGKIKAMREVMENFQYNSELGALNSVKNEKAALFERHKLKWEEKVGYKESTRR